jgi:CRISPR-associated protein (TIGR03984 family)
MGVGMTREILNLGWEINPVNAHMLTTDALYDWLSQFATDGDILLAHAVDGVIWGRVSNGTLHTSHEIDRKISPELRIETLQQLRLFNTERELYLWRDGDGWQARRATEVHHEHADAVLKEHHILWGTKGTLQAHGFTLLEDGSQGLRHIVPIDASGVNEKHTRACMRVHHYLGMDSEAGVASIVYSRLAGIEVMKL